jgi:hypothetical protein
MRSWGNNESGGKPPHSKGVLSLTCIFVVPCKGSRPVSFKIRGQDSEFICNRNTIARKITDGPPKRRLSFPFEPRRRTLEVVAC